MPRARSIPANPAPPKASNVVVLRPGFALPDADPKPKKRLSRRSKSLLKTAVAPTDLLKTAPEKKAGKSSKSKALTIGSVALLIPEELPSSPLVENPHPSPNDPTFKRLLANLPKSKLREAFPVEANAHKNLLSRAKGKKCTVHPRWKASFGAFMADMGPCPEGYSIDRKNPHDPLYGPGQCQWADRRTQSNNRRNTRFLTDREGTTRAVADWERITGRNARTMARRYTTEGWTQEEAIRGYREGGRRRGGSPKTTPVTPVTPAEPKEDGWPTGATPSKWEAPYIEFKARFAAHLVYSLSRAVFFAWIGGNRLRSTAARLRERYPGYDDPDAIEPPAVRADPQYAVIAAYEAPVREAHRLVWADPYQRELLLSLRLQWPSVTDPARVHTDCQTG